MISQEDSERFLEAQKCKDCLGWHSHCKAECCKIIFLNINIEDLKKGSKLFALKPNPPLSLRDRRYYQLRDVECVRGFLRFKKERIVVIGRKVMYIHPCKLLKGNLCEGHPENKPALCKALTLETAHVPGQPFELTENCLFKYKSKEVIQNAE